MTFSKQLEWDTLRSAYDGNFKIVAVQDVLALQRQYFIEVIDSNVVVLRIRGVDVDGDGTTIHESLDAAKEFANKVNIAYMQNIISAVDSRFYY